MEDGVVAQPGEDGFFGGRRAAERLAPFRGKVGAGGGHFLGRVV